MASNSPVDFVVILRLFQLGIVIAVAAVALLFCLSKRHVSPWMYWVAFGLAGTIASSIPLLLLQLLEISGSLNEGYFRFTWILTLMGIGDTIADLALYGGLIGLMIDISRQLEMWKEISRDGRTKSSSGRDE